jgi:hypothetical protein
VGWTTLPRHYLEEQFDALGLERNLETGIKDTAENVEKLSDYEDERVDRIAPPDQCPGSNQPVNGDQPKGNAHVICSTCSRPVLTYARTHPVGRYKSKHSSP